MKFTALLLFLALPALCLTAKELEGERAAAQAECPSPEAARAKMSVPEGYEVRCFAHEPMVQNPVAMTWDHRGRLWVVELYEYPEGTPLPVDKRPFGGKAVDGEYHPVPAICQAKDNPLPQGTHAEIPKDRVIILEDTDNDGVADKRTVFVEGLDMSSAIVCGDDGIYVGQQPHLLHFKDTDGDDHADQWRICLTGFGREDTHELLNSFNWGPDGWLYLTHGVFTNSKVRRPGEPEDKGMKFDAGVGRCRPGRAEAGKTPEWQFEVFSDGTSNPWGTDYDTKGNYFVSACVIDHLFHMAPGGIYVRQGGAPENPYSYEQLQSIVNYKHFRAAYAGIQIYQGGRYPADTNGHLFIGNIHDNAIHEEQVSPVGASFKASPVRDFLRANDGWFRPVSTQTGPDGFLWVMDWCDKYPCYQNAKANPEGVDRARGRIWRVVSLNAAAKGAPDNTIATRQQKDLDLKKLSPQELVKLMENPNSWMRRTARRLLKESWKGEWSKTTKSSPHELLTPLIGGTNPVSLSMEAAWTLLSCNDITPGVLKTLATSEEAPLRIWAARTAGDHPETADFTSALATLATDKDPTVRAAAAIALRQTQSGKLTVTKLRTADSTAVKPEAALAACITLIKAGADKDDVVLPFMIWQAFEPVLIQTPGPALQQLATLPADSAALSSTIAYKAMRRLCDLGDVKNIDFAMTFCDQIKSQDSVLARALEGLAKGQESSVLKPTTDVTAALTAWRSSANVEVKKYAQILAVRWGDPAAIQDLVTRLLDDKAPAAERVAALQNLRKIKSDIVRDGYHKLVASLGSQPEELVVETLRAAPDLGDDNTPGVLIPLWKTLKPAQRTAFTEALVTREPWALKLLDAVKDKAIPAADVPMTVVRKLSTHSNADLKSKAAEVFGAWHESNEDTKALISAKRKAVMIGEPNIAAGKVLFQATCAICHTFYGGGQKVGPELIGSGRSNLDAILANVIDPNQIIGNGYEAINVTTKDNRLVSGRLVEDTPTHVKLLGIGGAEQIVARDQIAKLENTHQSLMPMGFGALPDEAFRDLIWYVLAPPEEGPLTKEKKAALSANMDAASNNGPKKKSDRAIDWESVSLWNPSWKVSAPDFERTPIKLPEFHGRKNVLLMHPFSKDVPATLERTIKLEAGKPHQLTATVAAHDQGDWEFRLLVNGELVHKQLIDHDGERWKTITVDLTKYAGQEVKLQLEGAATAWAWEFGYWGEITLD